MHVSFNVDLISVVKDIPVNLEFHMQASRFITNQLQWRRKDFLIGGGTV